MSTRTWTYAEYAALPEDGRRFEVIEGSLVEMAAPTRLHQAVSKIVLYAVEAALRAFYKNAEFEVLFAPFDVALGSDVLNSCPTVVQPDLLILPRGPNAPCQHGPPPWVLEVLSPSTRRRDQVVKLGLYEKYGVGECWLVDTEQRRVTAYRRSAGGFLPGEVYTFDQTLLIQSLGICVDLRGLADHLAEQDAIDRDTGLKQ